MNNFSTISKSVESLLANARAAIGTDIVDEAAVEPLTVFVNSVNRDGKLSARGALDLEAWIHRSLLNRLRMLRDFQRYPEIREEQVKPPIIVCGVTRTGSTKTHKLLAATGDFNWLSLWRSLNPALVSGDRGESTQARIEDTERFVEWYEDRSPEMKFIHKLDAREPEEETFVLAHSLRSPVLSGMVEAPGYIEWLMGGGVVPQFSFLLDVLRYLQWQGLADPGKRWVLKSPFYSGLEPLIQETFPGAHLVMTHRHPFDTIPSTCGLFGSYRKPYTEATIDASAVMVGLAQQTQAHLRNRAAMPSGTFLDIRYDELVKNPESVVRRVYAHAGAPLSDAALARVKEWDLKNPPHKHGHHSYSLESYGLSANAVEKEFADYIRFYESLAIPS